MWQKFKKGEKKSTELNLMKMNDDRSLYRYREDNKPVSSNSTLVVILEKIYPYVILITAYHIKAR